MYSEVINADRSLAMLVDGGWIRRLSPTELAVCLVVLRYTSADGTSIPSRQVIINCLGCQDGRHIRKAISSLQRIGILELTAKGGGRRSNRYRLKFPPALRPESQFYSINHSGVLCFGASREASEAIQ